MVKIAIFLIRHGESVDNAASVYAGSRDSSLTSHGVTQARRLATHLSKKSISHIFASNLQRAVRTAEVIRDAQVRTSSHLTGESSRLEVVQLPELREKHYGSSEGKKFGQRERHLRAPGEESQEAMRIRTTRFVETQLLPIVTSVAAASTTCSSGQVDLAKEGPEDVGIAIVAHGVILGILLRVLRSQAYFHRHHCAATLDTQPAWSNTGYTRLDLTAVDKDDGMTVSFPAVSCAPENQNEDAGFKSDASTISGDRSCGPPWSHLCLAVAAVNQTAHLVGLKKTRGGIGSAQFDENQKTLTSFGGGGGESRDDMPKKRKADERLEK